MTTVITGRLGRDAQIRYTANDKAVCNLAVAVNYGQKEDGKYPTQWYDVSLWGKQAESLAQYLIKGTVLCLTVRDLHIEPATDKYQAKLVGTAIDIGFAPSQPVRDEAAAQKPKPANRPARQSQDDLDDDIPF